MVNILQKKLSFKTPMPKSDLCNYSGVYIVAKGRISATGTNNANRRHKKVSFKSNAPFRL